MSKLAVCKLCKVGTYNSRFNDILNISLPCVDIWQSDGLIAHLQNHNHVKCVPYLCRIPDIITCPDYIGCNPRVPNSIELVKRYSENVLVSIELDKDDNYLYVSSLYDINESKIQHRLIGGRLKIFK